MIEGSKFQYLQVRNTNCWTNAEFLVTAGGGSGGSTNDNTRQISKSYTNSQIL